MKNLFILDGLAGTGKSDCIKYLQNDYRGKFNVCILKKYSTRKKRQEEKSVNHQVELEFITEENFNIIAQQEGKNFFKYQYGDEKNGYFWYGIKKSTIDDSLNKNQNVFVIIRSVKCIMEIQNAYKDASINVVPVFVYTDPHLVAERLKNEGYSEQQIDYRTTRSKQAWDEYLSQAIPIHKEIIINNSSRNDFHIFIEHLMMKYDKEETQSGNTAIMTFPDGDVAYLGKSLIGHRSTMDKYLSINDYARNVFFMIKYRGFNQKLRTEIKSKIESKGFHCVIANETNLTFDVYNPIALTYCCKYGIAVFDEPEEGNVYSPNVAYELGIMQSQGKRCLVVKNEKLKGKDFFDILKDEGNYYDDSLDLLSCIESFLNDIAKE